MKSLYSIVLLLLVAQSLCFQSPDSVNKALAWKVQCRIKAKGTFKLSHLRNKDADFAKMKYEQEELEQQIADNAGNAEKVEMLQMELTNISESIAELEENNEEVIEEYTAEREALDAEITDFTEAVQDDEAEPEAREEAAAELALVDAKSVALEAEHAVFLNGRDNTVDLFLEDAENSIELPNICKYRLTSNELLELGVKGQEFREIWMNAFGPTEEEARRVRRNKRKANMRFKTRMNTSQDDEEEVVPEPAYDNMPPLNPGQFDLFYTQVTQDIQDRDPLAIYAGDQADPVDQQNLVFDTAVWYRARTLINWLEFWVYMCTGGDQPQDHEWMVDEDEIDPDVLEEMDPLFAQLPEEEGEARMMKKANKQHRAGHKHSQKLLNKRRK